MKVYVVTLIGEQLVEMGNYYDCRMIFNQKRYYVTMGITDRQTDRQNG